MPTCQQNLAALKKRAVSWVDEHAAELISLADEIHSHPELGFAEHRAAALLTHALAEAGFTVMLPYTGLATAFRAELETPAHGLARPPEEHRESRIKVAFLAEYDALPGIGHACAHNLSGVASAGAALALAELGEDLIGTVVVFGTPAEEGTVSQAGGKVHLAEAGAFADIDSAMMFHFGDCNVLTTPLLARESLVLSFHGRAAHAAGSPESGLNALDAAVLFFNAVNALRQHLTADVRVHGIISHGGESPNTIPDFTEVKLNVRAETLASLTTVVERVRDCARGAALATGTRVEFAQWAKTYADFIPDRRILDLLGQNLTALGVEWEEAGTARFSSDIGTVSHLIPCAHPYLAIVPRGVPGHSEAFCRAAASPEGHRAMLLAAKALALAALDIFDSK